MAYVPVGASTQNPGLQHQAAVYYDRQGLSRLYPMLQFNRIGYKKTLPLKSGRTIQMYRFNVPGANLTPAAEGIVPNPVPMSSYTISAQVEQYTDFTTTSTLYEETDISNTIEEAVATISFRGALTADTITRLEVDSAFPVVPTVGANLTAADFKIQTTLMAGLNVMPYANGEWMAVVHPYCVYDLMADNTAGGFIDSTKYTNGAAVLNGEIGKIAGCRILRSTNVGNDGTTAPATKYYNYIFGYEAFAVIDLSGRGPKTVVDPANQRFKVEVFSDPKSLADPTGEIGTVIRYRFVYAAKAIDPQRGRIVAADASII
jgi:N4-gp56 family major capsid protein